MNTDHINRGLDAAAAPVMLGGTTRTLTLIATIGAGIAAGVFFAFSTFVMAGLRKLPPAQGLAAMQQINIAAPTPPFMIVLFGTALISVVLGVGALRHLDSPGAMLRLVGAAAYLLAIVLTAAYHVPHNDALAKLDPRAAGSAHAWLVYARDWTALNHLRTLGSAAGTALFALSLRIR